MIFFVSIVCNDDELDAIYHTKATKRHRMVEYARLKAGNRIGQNNELQSFSSLKRFHGKFKTLHHFRKINIC